MILCCLIFSPFTIAADPEFVATVSEISSSIKNEMVIKRAYKHGCPVPPERLRTIIFSYYDINDVVHYFIANYSSLNALEYDQTLNRLKQNIQ